MCIIDNNPKILKNLNEKGFICYESLSKLPKEFKILYGIVANWGPDHLISAEELINKGCKRLIIEKPISNNLSELNNFKRKFEKDIFITVHHFLRYTNFIEFLNKSEKKYNFGSPVGIRISGGAVCLSTSGTHYLDLACEVLKSEPITVSADLEIDYINPRDKSLAYIGGNASYRLLNGTFIHLSYTNKSSHSIRIEIIYPHGIIEIDMGDDKVIFLKRPDQELEKYGGLITRHGKNRIIEEVDFYFQNTVADIVDDLMFGKIPKVPISVAEISLKMILGAIQSHKKGQKINLNNLVDTGLRIS